MSPRPRLRVLCIRPGLNPMAGSILTVTADEWVEALREHADITVIDVDFDLGAVCERVAPDLIVLDALHWTRPWPLDIANARSHPSIPRVLFLNSDPHDPMRPLTLRLAREIGVEAVFINAEAYRQHQPSLDAVPCFFVPHFVDERVFHDRGLEKRLPVSIFGGAFAPDFYPWRARLVAEMPQALPAIVFPHPGYMKGAASPYAIQGEAYARMIGRSRFAIADTTRLDYVVRKHIEIPACGTVLIAPASDALTSYGFIDGETCVTGEGPELFEKVRAVGRDPERYERIRQAGLRLASDRYTRPAWRGMLDWLACRRRLRPGETVQQAGRYGPFEPVPTGLAVPSVAAAGQRDSAMSAALRVARDAILTGENIAAGEAAALQASTWIAHIAEPFFLLGIFALLRGAPAEAAAAISRRARSQGALDPQLGLYDPVEIAWLILIARLTNDQAAERDLRTAAETAPHVSVRRALWLFDRQPDGELDPALLARQPGDLLTVHWLGDEDFTVWSDLVTRVLAANTAGLRRDRARSFEAGTAEPLAEPRSLAS